MFNVRLVKYVVARKPLKEGGNLVGILLVVPAPVKVDQLETAPFLRIPLMIVIHRHVILLASLFSEQVVKVRLDVLVEQPAGYVIILRVLEVLLQPRLLLRSQNYLHGLSHSPAP